MNILIINYEYPPLGGGGGIATSIFAEELAKRGHSISIITSHFKGLKFVENNNGIKIYRVPVLLRTQRQKASLLSLVSWPVCSIICGLYLCTRNKFEVINSHFLLPSGTTGFILSRIFKLKHLVYIHGADIYDPERIELTPSGKGIFARILKYAGKIISNPPAKIACQSHDIKNRIISVYPMLESKIEVIPLPFKKPASIQSKLQQNSENSLKLISIGRLVRRKGYNYLLQAISMLPKYINVELTIIGDGPLKNELIVIAKNLELLDRVRFKGYVSDAEKYSLLADSDVYILSSLHEGMGIVLQEAMYVGLAIISTNQGGQNDLLTDGENAIMVAPQDPEALKLAIIKLYEKRDLREKFSQNNRLKIEDFFAEKVGTLFERCITF